MLSEALLAQFAASNNSTILVDDSSAHTVGIDITELRNRFYKETGRIILTNEQIKVLFDNEGGHIDFSTFDDFSIRVDFNQQRVAPNKGGDGFGI